MFSRHLRLFSSSEAVYTINSLETTNFLLRTAPKLGLTLSVRTSEFIRLRILAPGCFIRRRLRGINRNENVSSSARSFLPIGGFVHLTLGLEDFLPIEEINVN